MRALQTIASTALVSSIATFIAVAAHATLDTTLKRGESIIEIPVAAGRNNEICVVPKHFANVEYSEKDLKKEKELCALNEYTNVAFCPKTNSTNPGVDVHELPQGMTVKQLEAVDCKVIDPETKKNKSKKVAKYKQSTSCSYSPSILGYYHLSRLLGGVAHVPVAVIRTLDLPKHIAIGRRGIRMTPENELIHETWEGLISNLLAGAQSKRRDFLLTDNFDQSYGALLDDPKSDLYKEFFNSGRDNVARAEAFRDRNPIALNLAKRADIATIVPREFNAANVQKLIQIKEAGDMIILDTLLNQQDRYGNIDFNETFVYLDQNDRNEAGQPKLKQKNKLSEEEVKQLSALKIKRMVLADNDCGVAKDNIAKQVGLADRIAHLDPLTYRRLLQLNAIADHPHTKAFFIHETLFTEKDYASFRANLKELVAKLHGFCSSQRLRLDLDSQAHFTGQPAKGQSCDL